MLNKKLFAGAVFALAMFATALTASAFTFDSKIDTVQEKKDVQTVLNMTGANLSVDGVFGPKTMSAVKTFQTMKGLVPDGIIGAITRAALTAASASGQGTVGGTYPAGCTSAVGFSSTTGVACSTVSTLPAGCTAGAAFSSTTGQACVAGTTPVIVTGGAGDINITSTSTDVESQVVEGGKDVKVLGFKVEASGSDTAVSNLKVTMKNLVTTTASYRLSNVASEVAVWMGTTKVGSALVSDFSKDGTEYSKSIALSNAVVKMGSANKATFYVTVTALSNIDTNDMTGDNWAVLVNNVRFQDGTGVIMTSSDTAGSISTGTFEFADLATSGDVKVVVSKDSTSPIAQNVTVSTTGSTKDLPLVSFKVKTTGSEVSFDTLNITTALTTAGASDTYTTIVGDIKLMDASGNELATIDGSALDGTETFTLDDTYTIAKDTTATFKIVATINDGNNFTSGASLTASFASFSPEDSNGGVISDTGTATGAAQKMVYDVPVISLVSATLPSTATTHTDGTAAGQEDIYTATIVFNVTAPDAAPVYVPLDSFAYTTTGTSGVLYTVTGGATVTSANVQYSGLDNVSSITESASYRIDAGSTQKFTLTVGLKGNDAYGKVTMSGLWYEATNTTPDGTPLVSGLTNLYTPGVTLAK